MGFLKVSHKFTVPLQYPSVAVTGRTKRSLMRRGVRLHTLHDPFAVVLCKLLRIFATLHFPLHFEFDRDVDSLCDRWALLDSMQPLLDFRIRRGVNTCLLLVSRLPDGLGLGTHLPTRPN